MKRQVTAMLQVVGGIVTILLLLALLGNLREIGILWQPIGDGLAELGDAIRGLFH